MTKYTSDELDRMKDRSFLFDWHARMSRRRSPMPDDILEIYEDVGEALKDGSCSSERLLNVVAKVENIGSRNISTEAVAKRKKQKRGPKPSPDNDKKIANQYHDGLLSGLWPSQVGYLKKMHPDRWKKNRNSAKAWLSTLLKRADAVK